jgi:hypothetical protein
MIQVMEYLFIYATLNLLVILSLVQLVRKDYMLGFSNKNAALSTSNYLTLFTFIEILTLKTLPLLSKVALAIFCLTDLRIERIDIFQAIRFKHPISQRKLQFILRLGLVAALLYLEFVQQGIAELSGWG